MLKLMQKKAFPLFVEVEKGFESGNEIKNLSKKPSLRILEILKRELALVELEVKDVSYQHVGHAGVRGSDNGETHFELKVVSKEFEGKSMVKRHRLVYSLLEDELENGLHVLSIGAKTPTEIGSE
ncbi:putative BolA protein [Helianthus annuus]|nr:putative BolA protein [Helianthus annuus]